MRWLVLFSLGCGRIEFAPRSDAATDTSDAAPVTCWSAWAGALPPLGAPTLVSELDTFGIEHDMALTADGLHLYFSSDRTGTLGGDDVWVATRPDRDSLFTTIDHVPSLSSPTSEGAFFTRDGLTGLLAAELPGGQGLSDVWLARRDSLADPFAVTQDGLGNLNGAGADYDTWVSSDGLTLYYSSQQQLMTATRSSTAVGWGGPVAVAGVNTAPSGTRACPRTAASSCSHRIASRRCATSSSRHGRARPSPSAGPRRSRSSTRRTRTSIRTSRRMAARSTSRATVAAQRAI